MQSPWLEANPWAGRKRPMPNNYRVMAGRASDTTILPHHASSRVQLLHRQLLHPFLPSNVHRPRFTKSSKLAPLSRIQISKTTPAPPSAPQALSHATLLWLRADGYMGGGIGPAGKWRPHVAAANAKSAFALAQARCAPVVECRIG